MSTSIRFVFLTLIAIVSLAASSCNRPALLLDANANNLRTAREISAKFYERYGQQVGIKDQPFVTIGMEGGQGYSYDASHNVLFITPYSHADFDTQKFFARSSEDDRGDDVYNEIMFRFFTAHQFMHLVYDELPLSPVTQYEEELRINVLTWIFLSNENMIPLGVEEQLVTLENIKNSLRPRYPAIRNGSIQVSELRVDDNASYWYVTAQSMTDAYLQACTIKSPGAYVASLKASQLSAATGR